VTARLTGVPPSRSDIEAEITIADERRLRGDHENRADAAATILRWLIGDDDHVPVRDKDRGEPVGGFGDIVRSPAQIAGILAVAVQRRQQAGTEAPNLAMDARGIRFPGQGADYLAGVIATLDWILGRAVPPITRAQPADLTTRDLKTERLHAEDVIEQASQPWLAERLPPLWYGEGVKAAIDWLLGDSTAAPVDPVGGGA
jgi:hypothetical protein